jgi:glucosamine--fructose-6-phosphate aminotransferase (isomerizing)
MPYLNPMEAEVFSLPELIREQVPVMDERVRSSFTVKDFEHIRQIILTGCGDSYYAGLGTRFFFNRLCGVPVHGLNAMDTGRYVLFDTLPDLARDTLVMTVSVSGSVTRTIEAMRIAKDKGALTIAITGNPQAPLAQACQHLIDCTIPQLPDPQDDIIPGVRSYRMTLLAHYLLAVHFAETTGRISPEDGEAYRAHLLRTADAIEATLAAGAANVRTLVGTLSDEDYFLFVGHGPHRASAEFSAAKVIEAAGLIAYGQDTEEWAHIQHFENVRPAMPTFFFCSGQRGHDRVQSLIPHVKNTGRTLIGILSDGCADDHAGFDHVLRVEGATQEYFTPMVYPVLTELFAAYLAHQRGLTFFRREFPHYKNADIARIRGTNTITPEALKAASER